MLAEEAAAAIVVVAGGSSLAGLEQRDLLHDVRRARVALRSDAVTAREGRGKKRTLLPESIKLQTRIELLSLTYLTRSTQSRSGPVV